MSLIATIIFFMSGAVISALTFYQDFKKTKKMTTFKGILIILFVVFVVFGIWDIFNRAVDANKDKLAITGSVKISRKELGRQIDTSIHGLHNSIKGIDVDLMNRFKKSAMGKSKKLKLFASLRLGPGENPLVLKTNNDDSLILRYNIVNVGSGTAFNLRITDFFVFIKNGMPTIQKVLGYAQANETVIIPSNAFISGDTYIKTNRYTKIDSPVLCFKLDFSDSTRIRKSFIKILNFKPANLEFTESSDREFKTVFMFLKKNKYWQKPFKQ